MVDSLPMADSLRSLSPRPMSTHSADEYALAPQVPQCDAEYVLCQGGKVRTFFAGIGQEEPRLPRPNVSRTLFARKPLRDLLPYARSEASESTLSAMLKQVSDNCGGKRRRLVDHSAPRVPMARVAIDPPSLRQGPCVHPPEVLEEGRTFAMPFFATPSTKETEKRGYFDYLHVERGDSRLCFGGPCEPCTNREWTADVEEGHIGPPYYRTDVDIALGGGPKKGVVQAYMIESPDSNPPHALLMLRRHREINLFDITWDGTRLHADRLPDQKLDPNTFYVLRWRETPWLLAYTDGRKNTQITFHDLTATQARAERTVVQINAAALTALARQRAAA